VFEQIHTNIESGGPIYRLWFDLSEINGVLNFLALWNSTLHGQQMGTLSLVLNSVHCT